MNKDQECGEGGEVGVGMVHSPDVEVGEEMPDVLKKEGDEEPSPRVSSWRTARMAFYILGLCMDFGPCTLLAAAKDLKLDLPEESKVAAVFVASAVPALFFKAAGPFLYEKVPYAYRIVTIAILLVVSFGLVGSPSAGLVAKLIGVAMASAAMGVGEGTGLALSARYDVHATNAFSQGWGLSGLMSATLYAVSSGAASGSTEIILRRLAVGPAAAIPFAYFVVLPPCPTVQDSKKPLGQEPIPWDRRIVALQAAWPDLVALSCEHTMRYIIMAAFLPRLSNAKAAYARFNVLLRAGAFAARALVPSLLARLPQLPPAGFVAGCQALLALGLALTAAGPESVVASKAAWASERLSSGSIGIFMQGTVGVVGIAAGAAFQVAVARMRAQVPQDGQEFTMQFATLANQVGIVIGSFSAAPISSLL
eukprot:Hpha_TRINITY_DN18628_c0_g1::TRINITY_DN18628_c0_g1_i1::g.115574::m.115574/K12389/BTS, CLN3; battenin